MIAEPFQKTAGRMPVLFVGHGSPMNAIVDNRWSRSFKALSDLLPRPNAILSISAHWYVLGTFLTGNERPETIHDFGGFPRELYEIQYPAPGDVKLAERGRELLRAFRPSLKTDWGLDHGTWSVLRHVFPEADVPVFQLSIDTRKSAADYVEMGRALSPLREEGVLIMGSGNIVHNLGHAMEQYQRDDPETPSWAEAFDGDVVRAIRERNGEFLTHAAESPDGRMAHPTPDHYVPLLFVFGASEESDAVRFPIEGFDLGSLSMRCVLLG